MDVKASTLFVAAVLVACLMPGAWGSAGEYDYLHPGRALLQDNVPPANGLVAKSNKTGDIYYLYGYKGYPTNIYEIAVHPVNAELNCTKMGMEQPDAANPEDVYWARYLDAGHRVINQAGDWYRGSFIKTRPNAADTGYYRVIKCTRAMGWQQGYPIPVVDGYCAEYIQYVCVQRASKPVCGSMKSCCGGATCCDNKICCHQGSNCCKKTLQRSYPLCVPSGATCPP